MLTKEEKQQIHLEEAYRQEVRNQLQRNEPKRSSSERVLAFLNSALGLWLLSTLVLSFGSFLYTRWEKRRDDARQTLEKQRDDARRNLEKQEIAQRENNLLIRRLDTEISSRLNYFASAINHASKVGDKSGLGKAIAALDRPSESNYLVTVFPEYANRSLRSLLWELLQIVPANEKDEITKAFNQSKYLYEIYLKHYPTVKGSRQDSGVDGSQNVDAGIETSLDIFAIQMDFNLERWGKPLNKVAVLRLEPLKMGARHSAS
jgi:hypothetical protein